MRKEVWLFVFLVGLLAFNWPTLQIFSGVLPAYLFIAWFLLIAVIFTLARGAAEDEDGG